MIEFSLDKRSGVATYTQICPAGRAGRRGSGGWVPAIGCRRRRRWWGGWPSTRTRCCAPIGSWSPGDQVDPGRGWGPSSSGRWPGRATPLWNGGWRRRCARLAAGWDRMTSAPRRCRPCPADRPRRRRHEPGPHRALTSMRPPWR